MSDVLFSGTELQATTSVSPSQGFHFIISDLISLNAVQSPVQDSNCAFYILHGFPSDVFIDPYELHQRVQDRITPNFVGLWGDTDLELPVAAVDLDRGSSILFGPFSPASFTTATTPKGQPKGGAGADAAEMLEIHFPLHARYPLPNNTDTNSRAPSSECTHSVVQIPVPALVHVCERLAHEDQQAHNVQHMEKILSALTDLAPSFISPFDASRSTIHLSYPFQALGAQGTATEKSLAPTDTNALMIRVPTGALDHFAFVQPLTLLAVTLCAIYVAYRAILVATSQSVSSATRPLQGYKKGKVE